jgi:iron(III) transport system permease protein
VASSTSSSRRPPLGLVGLTAAVAVAFALPAGYVVWRNLTLGSDPLDVLFSDRTIPPLRRTLLLAVLVAPAAAVTGTLLAWLNTRTDLPLRPMWRIVAPLPLVYPSFVGAAAFISALNPGGLADDLLGGLGLSGTPQLRGLGGAWLVLTLFTYPYVYLPTAARLAGLPPSLEESARLLGDRPLRVFWRVVLPQTWSAIMAGTLLVFLYTISDFGAVQLMRYDTLTRAIFTTRFNDRAVSFALSLILMAVALTVVALERAAARRQPPASLTRGRAALQVQLGWWKGPALAFIGLVICLGLVAPAASLADWAITGLVRQSQGRLDLAIDAQQVASATWSTTQVSVVAALVAMAAVLPLAYLTARYRSRIGGASNAVVVAGFALPGLVVALSLVFWTLNTPGMDALYLTFPLLIFAYVVHFGAQSTRASQVAVATVPSRLEDAARTLGAGRLRRFATIELPLMLPGLLAGAGLVLLSTMKELPATLLIAPIGFQTLTTRIWGSFEDGFIAEAGLMSLVLVGLSAVLTWALVIRRTELFD